MVGVHPMYTLGMVGVHPMYTRRLGEVYPYVHPWARRGIPWCILPYVPPGVYPGVYTTLYHPGYTLPHTYRVTCTSVLHRVSRSEALGSTLGYPLGMRRIQPPLPLLCERGYTLLRRVAPLSLVRMKNDRIDEGTPPRISPMLGSCCAECSLFHVPSDR